MIPLIFDIPAATALEKFCYILAEINEGDTDLLEYSGLRLDPEDQQQLGLFESQLGVALNRAGCVSVQIHSSPDGDCLQLYDYEWSADWTDTAQPTGMVDIAGVKLEMLRALLPPLRFITYYHSSSALSYQALRRAASIIEVELMQSTGVIDS